MVVEPLAKLPDESVTLMLSLLPVPVVTTLPNWSSMMTPVPKAVPAVIEEVGGWVLMTSLLGAAATMLKLLVVAEVTEVWVVSETVTV